MVDVTNTSLSELVQVHQQTALVLHPPTPVPSDGCVSPNLLTRRGLVSLSQLSVRRSLPFLVPNRLRDYRLRVREETGVVNAQAVRFTTVDFVDDDGRAMLLDSEEISLLRTLVARLWTHPQFIIFDLGPRGAHPINHLPPTPDVYRAWFESVRLPSDQHQLIKRDHRLIYEPSPSDTAETLVEVEELVWESLRDYFRRYTHTGAPLDPDYQPEAQQVLAYYHPGSSLLTHENQVHKYLSITTDGSVRPATYVQEYFRWHYMMDVHLDATGVARTVSGRSVDSLVPGWPPNHLLLSADPLWVIALLTWRKVPIIYHNGLYLTTDTDEHRRMIATLRGTIDDWVETRHQQGALVVEEPRSTTYPAQIIDTIDGDRLGRPGVVLLAIRTMTPSIVYRVMNKCVNDH